MMMKSSLRRRHSSFGKEVLYAKQKLVDIEGRNTRASLSDLDNTPVSVEFRDPSLGYLDKSEPSPIVGRPTLIKSLTVIDESKTMPEECECGSIALLDVPYLKTIDTKNVFN